MSPELDEKNILPDLRRIPGRSLKVNDSLLAIRRRTVRPSYKAAYEYATSLLDTVRKSLAAKARDHLKTLTKRRDHLAIVGRKEG